MLFIYFGSSICDVLIIKIVVNISNSVSISVVLQKKIINCVMLQPYYLAPVLKYTYDDL